MQPEKDVSDAKSAPEYLKVKRFILKRLASAEFQPHDRLPSERRLCETLGANRNTIRHALSILEREGSIYRSGRRGWFASGPRLVFDPSREHVNFDKLARKQGFLPSWDVKESSSCPATGELAELFEVEEGEPLYSCFEVGILDGQPAYYSECYFLARLCPGILPKIVSQPMTDVLREDYAIDLFQKRLLIRPISLSARVTAQLDLPARSPGLFIRRVKRSQHGDIVQVDYEYWRYDAVELRSEFP